MDTEQSVKDSVLAEGVASTLRRLRSIMKTICTERAQSVEQDLLCGSSIVKDGLKEKLKEYGFNVIISDWYLAQPNEIRVIVRYVRKNQIDFELYGQVLVEHVATDHPN